MALAFLVNLFKINRGITQNYVKKKEFVENMTELVRKCDLPVLEYQEILDCLKTILRPKDYELVVKFNGRRITTNNRRVSSFGIIVDDHPVIQD